MIQVVLLVVFFGVLTISALLADGLGVLPSAETLEAQDEARRARWRRRYE